MKTRSKFNVSKDKKNRTYNDVEFDSELEMRYYRDVVEPRIQSGELIRCEQQKKYILQPAFKRNGKTVLAIEYKADFVLMYADGREEIIDTKGFPDPQAILKRKMFWYVYPHLDYRWIGYSKIDGGWCDFEIIKEGRRTRKKLKVNKGDINGKESKKNEKHRSA